MMNVIRMIKLFGWEPRIAGQLNAKREEELAAVRRNRMLGLSNKICKCVVPSLTLAVAGLLKCDARRAAATSSLC